MPPECEHQVVQYPPPMRWLKVDRGAAGYEMRLQQARHCIRCQEKTWVDVPVEESE